MRNRVLLVILVVLLLVAASVVVLSGRHNTTPPQKAAEVASATSDPHGHSHAATPSSSVRRVPAFQTAAEAKNLDPTLAPAQFTGKTRQAYQAAKDIPETLAQLPCYCECDRGFGHKSLHSCFVDGHASQCAVCVDEALLAYRLQKEQKLTSAQVREKIIEKYSASE